MRKIKTIHTYTASDIQHEIDEWMNKNPKINIISVTGSSSSSQHGSREFITYILYEDKISEIDLLKS